MNVLRQKSLHDSALTYFPHFESTISQELSIEVFSRHERGFRNTKQREHLTLQISELDVECLYDFVALGQLVPHRKAEQMQDLFSARVGTLTLLGVEWQLSDFLTLHGEAQLTLNEGLNQQCEEVQREQRLDPRLVLEEHRRNLVHRLDLF